MIEGSSSVSKNDRKIKCRTGIKVINNLQRVTSLLEDLLQENNS